MKKQHLGILIGLILLIGGGTVMAATCQSSSSGYCVNEAQFGPGGLLNATSPSYKAQQGLGSTGVGTVKSTNYTSQAGFLTPNVPFLEMVVTPATINLGTVNSSSTATGTAAFHVRAYVDSGYTVLTMNNPPKNESGFSINALSSPTASSAGTEQFGINLVHNLTSCGTPAPANFGADPVPLPNSSYATGQAASGYNTCGLFKYVKGDTIAQSNAQGWGETDFTISYIVNIAPFTRAGSYSMTQDLVAVATF